MWPGGGVENHEHHLELLGEKNKKITFKSKIIKEHKNDRQQTFASGFVHVYFM